VTVGSIRVRLFLAGAIAVALALTAAAIGFGLLFERHVERRAVNELTVDLDALIAGIDRDAVGMLAVVSPPADPRFDLPFSGAYWQVDLGASVARSRSLWDQSLNLDGSNVGSGLMTYHADGPLDAELLVAERTVALPARLGGAEVTAAIAIDRSEITEATGQFREEMIPYLVLLGVVLAGAGFAQVVIGLRPLRAVRTKLGEVKAGRATRLGSGFPSEVRPLTAEVDALLDMSDRNVERARARAADLAHALKTPLQVLAGDVARLREKGQKAVAEDIGAIAHTMQRVVDREMMRARITPSTAATATRVKTVMEQVVGVVKRTPEGEALDWNVNAAENLAVRLEADPLAEALGNLVENAARHAAAEVIVSAAREGERIRLSVHDDGPGIPAARLAEVTRRGTRLDRGGSAGLGLAIVSDIVEAAGGEMAIANESPGLEVTLVLPAANVSQAS